MCIYHEDVGSDCLLVGSNIVKKEMHVGAPGPKLHHVLLCDANGFDCLVSSNEPCQRL